MRNYFFIGFGLLVSGIIFERLFHKAHYNCHAKAYAYNIGNYFNILLVIALANFLCRNQGRRNNAFNFSIVGIFLSVIFQIIWNIFGVFWMFDAAMKRAICLSFLDIFLSILFQILTLMAISIGIIYLIVPALSNRRNRIQGFGWQRAAPRYDPEQVKEMFVRKNLVSIYSQKTASSKSTIHTFLSNSENQSALLKIPLLSEEKNLMWQFYLKIIDESTMLVLQDNQETLCTICMKDYLIGDQIFLLSCNHCYHEGCCLSWLKIKISCPTCRLCIRKDLVLRVTKDSTN